jgi:chromosome partitioning protein
MRRIALVNQKGGCGKTTTAVNLSSCLAAAGKRVLLIDLDPQGHAALGLGFKADQIEKSIYEVLLGEIPVQEAIRPVRENLSLICSDVVLSAFEQVMAGVPGREYKLARSLRDIDSTFDLQIVDCPPSVGLLTMNGLLAATEVIVPVDPSSFSLDGVDKLLDTIRVVGENTGHRLPVMILVTNVDRRTKFCREMVENVQTRFPGRFFHTVINTCTSLRESAGRGMSLIEHNRSCIAAHDFLNLTEEVLRMEEQGAVAFADVEMLAVTNERSPDRMIGGYVFTLAAPAHDPVQIAGDFNDWIPEPLDFNITRGREEWRKKIPLAPGSYAYKYVINGKWIPDPDNSVYVDDHCGGLNSIITIKPAT